MATLQKSIDKKNAVLKATLSLVNDGGFQAASMAKIAKMAAVSPATIYLYFKNKQDLINQLYLITKAQFCSIAFANYDESLSVKKGFEAIWYNIAKFKLGESMESYFLSQCDNTPIVDAETQKQGVALLQPLISLWERGQSEKIIKPISPYLLYAYTIYPIAFLMNIQKRENYTFDQNCLKNAFQAAWDSIKLDRS